MKLFVMKKNLKKIYLNIQIKNNYIYIFIYIFIFIYL